MTERIGELSEIIPVRMRPNDHIGRPPPIAPDPDVGLRWGRASQFQFSAANPLSAEDGGELPPPLFVKNAKKLEFETRILQVPEAQALDVQEYIFKSCRDIDAIPGSRQCNDGATGNLPVVQYSSKEESVQEITGFTATPNGTIVHYRPAVWKYLINIRFNHQPSPKFIGQIETLGQKP